MKTKRENCAAAGREVRQLQREHLREVVREMREAIEGLQAALTDHKLRDIKRFSLLVADAQASKALEKARRLGL